jgi:hypothetical protein
VNRKFMALTIIITLILFAAPLYAVYTLPEFENVSCGKLSSTELDTASGKRGVWLERDYRTPAGTSYHAIWMEGAGEKRWDIPTKEISSDDGPLGSGATYETLTLMNNPAVFETHPSHGLSLTVKIKGMGTLTLESQNSDRESAIAFAREILTKMKGK